VARTLRQPGAALSELDHKGTNFAKVVGHAPEGVEGMGMGVPAPAGKVLAAIAQAALVLAASSAIAIGLTTSPSPLAAADGWIESVFFRFFSQARPPSDRIVIIGITEETIDQLPYRSPVDRGFLAKILTRLRLRPTRQEVCWSAAGFADKHRIAADFSGLRSSLQGQALSIGARKLGGSEDPWTTGARDEPSTISGGRLA
jgi:hypothetical protein